MNKAEFYGKLAGMIGVDSLSEKEQRLVDEVASLKWDEGRTELLENHLKRIRKLKIDRLRDEAERLAINYHGLHALMEITEYEYMTLLKKQEDSKVPEDEADNVLYMFWIMLQELERITYVQADVHNKLTVNQAYGLLNRIGYTKHRPRWEKQ
jgi:hypothetical protein